MPAGTAPSLLGEVAASRTVLPEVITSSMGSQAGMGPLLVYSSA